MSTQACTNLNNPVTLRALRLVLTVLATSLFKIFITTMFVFTKPEDNTHSILINLENNCN